MSQPEEGISLESVPGLLRIGAGAWWRTAGWAAETYVKTASRVMQGAVSGESAAQLLRSASDEVQRHLRAFLRASDEAEMRPASEASPTATTASTNGRADDASLRERGAQLLRDSADVGLDDDLHPAYERILAELAPDEARILRLLATDGPQPAVDVRTGRPLNVGSELVAPGLSMIGAQAGVRHVDRVHAYLNNLHRLGLLWFSREPLTDPLRYQVLEVQPDVIEAMKRAGRGKTIRRTIHLTAFGEDFCTTVLPIRTAEMEALGTDADPLAGGTGTS
jgi:abortive infection alpha-like protein